MPAPNTPAIPVAPSVTAAQQPSPQPSPTEAAAAQLAAQGQAGTASEAHDRVESPDDALKRLLRGEMKKATPTIYVVLKAHDGALTQWTAVDHNGRMTWAVRLYNPNSKPELEVAAMIATKAGVDHARIAQIKAVIL
jgi:hypothetical protein